MNRLIRNILILGLLSLSFLVQAAPHPATSSSMIFQAQKGLFYSKFGFKIHSEGTDWLHQKPSSNPYIVTEYRAPKLQLGTQSALTIRVNPLKRKSTLKRYIKSWIKDYSKYGLEIKSSKAVKVNKNIAYLIDTLNKSSNRKIRQVILVKNKRAVIMTCRSHVKSFNLNLKNCNTIFNNFSWTRTKLTR